jgi:hypothetical protein
MGIEMRHLAGIPASLEIFESIVTEGAETKVRCIKGIPKDARMVNSFYDGYKQTVVFVYEHESFYAVSEGDTIPLFMPQMEFVD